MVKCHRCPTCSLYNKTIKHEPFPKWLTAHEHTYFTEGGRFLFTSHNVHEKHNLVQTVTYILYHVRHSKITLYNLPTWDTQKCYGNNELLFSWSRSKIRQKMTTCYTQLVRCCNTWSSPLHTLQWLRPYCGRYTPMISFAGTSNSVNTDATRLARLYLAHILSLYILESSKINKNRLPAKYLPLCLIFQDHWSGIKFTELGQGICFKTKSTQNTTSSRGIHVGFHHGVWKSVRGLPTAN